MNLFNQLAGLFDIDSDGNIQSVDLFEELERQSISEGHPPSGPNWSDKVITFIQLIFPGASVEEDDSGQVIIYTCRNSDGTELDLAE